MNDEPVSTSPAQPVAPAASGTEAPGVGAPDADAFTSVDPKTLPAAVQPIYKSLQADYTRKRQADAEARRTFDTEKQQFDAQRQQWLAEQANRPSAMDGSPSPSLDGVEPDVAKQLDSFVAERARQYVDEAMRPIKLKDASEQIERLKKEYGEVFSNSMSKIHTFLQQTRGADGRPTVSLDHAFKAVAHEELKEFYKAQAYKDLQVKAASPSSLKPGPSSDSVAPTDKPSMKEAFERAKQKASAS